ncbi:hypothetical protein RJ639_007914 [Escallonia herrerae]|uniref:FAF domain-containing protein n=1 Tax=Escallonia herrerae TaxID=1293975 RepID=A0AA88VUC3_9ASTE|nr:hypothetical protein RJ639_007914 [Escallonia herrerae]
MMMSFCKKSVHTFLGLSSSPSKDKNSSRNIPSPAGGLTLFTVADHSQRPSNVVESAAVKSSPPPSSPPSSTTTATTVSGTTCLVTKRDPGGIGFLDDVGGSVNGLMSCTESLGFESSDERRVDDEVIESILTDKNDSMDGFCASRKRPKRNNRAEEKEAVKAKKFPPPLSSLSHNGKPNFFLRPVRKDGRLELTEVKIFRPEILRASRQDGRLRLHLIHREEELEEEENEEEAVEEAEEKSEEERTEEWQFPAKSGGGDGLRRCHELVVNQQQHHHSHPHHNLHVWSQHCVTISSLSVDSVAPANWGGGRAAEMTVEYVCLSLKIDGRGAEGSVCLLQQFSVPNLEKKRE